MTLHDGPLVGEQYTTASGVVYIVTGVSDHYVVYTVRAPKGRLTTDRRAGIGTFRRWISTRYITLITTDPGPPTDLEAQA